MSTEVRPSRRQSPSESISFSLPLTDEFPLVFSGTFYALSPERGKNRVSEQSPWRVGVSVEEGEASRSHQVFLLSEANFGESPPEGGGTPNSHEIRKFPSGEGSLSLLAPITSF